MSGRRARPSGVALLVAAIVATIAAIGLVIAGLASTAHDGGRAADQTPVPGSDTAEPKEAQPGPASRKQLMREGEDAVERLYSFAAADESREEFVADLAKRFGEVPWAEWSAAQRADARAERLLEAEEQLVPSRDEWSSLELASGVSTARVAGGVRVDDDHAVFRDGDFSRLRDAGIHDLTFRVDVSVAADDAELGRRVTTKRSVMQSVQLICGADNEAKTDDASACRVLRFYPEPLQ
jgi:hypothetical protein